MVDDIDFITMRELKAYILNSKEVEEQLSIAKAPNRPELNVNFVCRLNQGKENFFIKIVY
jgi:hypothetical protein